ncbi:hypothetical protein SAMN05444397_104110 [Flavobacterium aquidurense]|uniref:Beta-lactamase enzyme family protein n=1 Tax=Flavobacterium frigidimaris TaxID=262320 RepID=A0ABX4BR47_FLAFR|nr:hypothetical protein [Flavobacterium frigidimaris]OXA79610.1 hypothetical protein B0A65_09590 [Flavobacterium frigidimaris]SDZ19546.1 hypothetical protein SAMN05444397_104110 [Flavobacterium aquidurense]
MKTTIKNVICILILMNTIHVSSQKRKQDIVYEEPSRFIESPLAVGKAETSQVHDKRIPTKNQSSFPDATKLASLEKEESNSVLISKLIKLMIPQKDSCAIIASQANVKSGLIIYHKDAVTAIILTDSKGFRSEDYLEKIASLYLEEAK